MNIKDGDSVVGKSKIKSLEKKNLIKKNEIDNELSNLWNTLGVTSDFKKKFQFRLTYFGEEYQKIIIEVEKHPKGDAAMDSQYLQIRQCNIPH